jgi:hypothetical protein
MKCPGATMLFAIVGFLMAQLVAIGVALIFIRRYVARVKASARAEAQEYIDDLESLVEERTCEVAERSAELLRAEKLSFAGKLAAGVAHEVNNPLAPLRANIEMVAECAQAVKAIAKHADRDTRELMDDLAPAVDEMRICVQRIMDLVTNFRSLTQLEVDEQPEKQLLGVALAEVFDGQVLPVFVENRVDPNVNVIAGSCALRAILRESGAFLVDVVGGRALSARGFEEGDGFALDLFAHDANMSDDDLREAMNPRFERGNGPLRMRLPLLLAHQLVERGGGVLDVTRDERGVGLRVRLPMREVTELSATPFD